MMVWGPKSGFRMYPWGPKKRRCKSVKFDTIIRKIKKCKECRKNPVAWLVQSYVLAGDEKTVCYLISVRQPGIPVCAKHEKQLRKKIRRAITKHLETGYID
jgi:hypothetical protein